MGMGSGISVMGKNTDLDANQVGTEQALANQLLLRSLQQPQQPDKSWTQGLARMAEMLVSAYKSSQAQKKQDVYNQSRQQSMSGLAAALAGGDPRQIAAAMATMKDPQSQMMALNVISQLANQKNERNNEVFKNNLGIRRDAAKESMKGQNDPVKNVQSQLNDVADKENQINSLISSTQDPQERQKLEALSGNLKATKESLLNQIKGVKGVEPDLRKEYSNQGFAALASGVNPSLLPPAQAEAMRSISLTPKLEPAMNAEIGKGIGQDVNEDVKQFKEGAGASRDIASKGSQILQILALNPGVDGGWGKENVTKVQTLMNRMFPGIAPNVGDQQSLQKLVGQLTPQAVGNLRQEGVQRITQGEIMNLIPKITATMENDREGMKQIIELHTALDAPIQKANSAMLQLRNQYAKAPGSFDIGSAMNDLQLALRKEVQEASINYMNNKISKNGEKLVINPNWDEKSNTIDKYLRVPASQRDNEPLQVIPDNLKNMSAPQGQPENSVLNFPQKPQDQQISQTSQQAQPVTPSSELPRDNQNMDFSKPQTPPTAQEGQQKDMYGSSQSSMLQQQNNMMQPQNVSPPAQQGNQQGNILPISFDQGMNNYMNPAPDKMSLLAAMLAKKQDEQNQKQTGLYNNPYDSSFA